MSYSAIGYKVKLYAKATGLVYYIRLTFADDLTLYKIGYTTMTIVKRVEGYYSKKDRCWKGGMGLPYGCHWRIISVVYKGSKTRAYEEEQRLHTLYQAERYRGPNVVKNGNTELYLMDILGLDTPARS